MMLSKWSATTIGTNLGQKHFISNPSRHRRPALTTRIQASAAKDSPSQPLHLSLAALAAGAVLLTAPAAFPPQAVATDAAKVGTCVLSKCQKALTQCLGDVQCVENLVCLQACSNSPDEVGCQIKCGDRYADKAVDTFNTCAVSEQKCVPQRVDEGLFPVPPDCSLDQKFDLSNFQGRWYITAGLNPLFDSFPCQEHYFATPEGSKGVVFAEINWRIPVGDEGDFLQRQTMQRFVQQDNPAILLNHGNEYLHYEDDWYIIGSKPDEYVFIYYRGQNDAWKGYGGATVYTRARTLPTELIPELREKAEAAGLDWDKFQITDNSCPPKPAVKGPIEELKEDIEVLEKDLIKAERFVEPKLQSFGKGFTILEKDLENVAEKVIEEVEEEEAILANELKKEYNAAGRAINRLKMEAEMGLPKWLRALPLPVKELIMPMP